MNLPRYAKELVLDEAFGKSRIRTEKTKDLESKDFWEAKVKVFRKETSRK